MRLTKMAAGVAVLGLALAGCGEDGGSADGTSGEGGDSTSAAESGDESDDTQAVSISEGKGGGTELFEAMTAAYQEAGSYHFEMSMDAQGAQLTGEGAAELGADPEETNMTTTMQLPEMGETSMRLVEGTVYMSMPAEAGLPTDASWLKIDPEGDGPMAQQFGQMVDEMSSSAEMQAQFGENAELIAVEEAGTDTVDGVEVTEYQLTIDAEDADEFMEATGQAGAGATSTEALTFSLWIDGDMLPRKMTGDLGGIGTLEMRFFDFGEPVEVEAPPEDEVTDLSSLMNQ